MPDPPRNGPHTKRYTRTSLAGASGTQGLEYVAFDKANGDRSFDPEDALVSSRERAP